MARPIIATKLYVPKRRRRLVARPRLHERMRAEADARLVLVSAPAGFGKMTLLAEWFEDKSRKPPSEAAFGVPGGGHERQVLPGLDWVVFERASSSRRERVAQSSASGDSPAGAQAHDEVARAAQAS